MRGLTIRRSKSHCSGGETSGHVREPLRLGAGWLAGRQAGRPAGRQPTVASHTGEADIDLTPEIPRSIDRRRYTWSRPPAPPVCTLSRPPPSAPSPAPLFSAVHPRRMRRRVPYSRWWRVWGLTHGLAAANPWILAAAAAPYRAFRGETAAATTAAAATVREGAAATRWRGGLRGQTFQSHPDGETRRDAPAIGSPSVLVSILADFVPCSSACAPRAVLPLASMSLALIFLVKGCVRVPAEFLRGRSGARLVGVVWQESVASGSMIRIKFLCIY